MKDIFTIFLLLITGYFAWAQIPDSLDVALQESPAAQDSTHYNPEELMEQIEEFTEADQHQHNSLWLPFSCYQSNKHFITLKNTPLNISKKGFTSYAHQLQSIRILQSNRAFYQVANHGNTIALENALYKLPVTITDTEAGMGDYRNSQGVFTLRKGELFQSDSTGIQLSVSGINGYWFGDYDSAANVFFHIYHFLPSGYLEYTHTYLAEDFAAERISLDEDDQQSRSSNEDLLLYHHPYLDLGIRYERDKVSNYKRNQFAILAKKQLAASFGNTALSLELLQQSGNKDKTWLNIKNSTQLDINVLSAQMEINFTDSDNFFAEAEAEADLFHGIGPLAKLLTCSRQDTMIYDQQQEETKIGAGITWRAPQIRFDLTYGDYDDSTFHDWYIESYLQGKYCYKSFDIKLRNWTMIFLNPDLQTQSEVELWYNLPPDNGIRLQLNSFYYSDYILNEELVSAAMNLDLILGIQISKRFEIQLQMVNLTNNYTLLGSPVSPFHYQYNFRWYFLN